MLKETIYRQVATISVQKGTVKQLQLKIEFLEHKPIWTSDTILKGPLVKGVIVGPQCHFGEDLKAHIAHMVEVGRHEV